VRTFGRVCCSTRRHVNTVALHVVDRVELSEGAVEKSLCVRVVAVRLVVRRCVDDSTQVPARPIEWDEGCEKVVLNVCHCQCGQMRFGEIVIVHASLWAKVNHVAVGQGRGPAV
jgi:hypothetical protein